MHKLILVPLAAAAALLGGATVAHAHPDGADPAARSHVKAPQAAKKREGTVDLQLLTISDWHGQLEPVGGVGGAPALKAWLDAARAEQRNTLTFMAGDSVGATPPISSAFGDEPAIEAMNRMGVDADTLGNHNFDAGLDRLRRHAELASFPFLSANLKGLEEEVPQAGKRRFFDMDGIRVAVIGITNEEAPELVAPGSFGSLQLTDGVEAADKAARQARRAGADVVVVLTHKGIRGVADGRPFGELVDFARDVDERLIDVVVGDHTNFRYSDVVDGVLAVENLSKGLEFAKVTLTVDRRSGVVSRGVEFVVPRVSGVTPDPGLQAYIDDLKEQLRPILGRVIGDSTARVLRTDSCGRSDSRLCESLVGNVVTDALRARYGTQVAITNSGGLRAALTCPDAGASAFCDPSVTTAPYPITRGGVLGVLPFGNTTATGDVTGTDIKAFLEHGVSAMPAANGRFAQVSGLCFSYEITRPAGSRVGQIVLQAADGSCTGAPVVSGETYSLATNDFVAAGGDGYPNILSRLTTRDLMDADVAAYLEGRGRIAPALGGRIACTDGNGPTTPNCPAFVG